MTNELNAAIDRWQDAKRTTITFDQVSEICRTKTFNGGTLVDQIIDIPQATLFIEYANGEREILTTNKGY